MTPNQIFQFSTSLRYPLAHLLMVFADLTRILGMTMLRSKRLTSRWDNGRVDTPRRTASPFIGDIRNRGCSTPEPAVALFGGHRGNRARSARWASADRQLLAPRRPCNRSKGPP